MDMEPDGLLGVELLKWRSFTTQYHLHASWNYAGNFCIFRLDGSHSFLVAEDLEGGAPKFKVGL